MKWNSEVYKQQEKEEDWKGTSVFPGTTNFWQWEQKQKWSNIVSRW